MKIKFISLNVWHGGRIFDPMVAFLEQEDADLLLLQEVYNDHDKTKKPRFRTVDILLEKFQFVAHDFAPTLQQVHSFGKVEQGNAIFSKFPIIKRYTPQFFNEPYNDNYIDEWPNYMISPRNLQHVVIELAGMQLDVMNFQGVWDLDGEKDSPKRLRMSKIIVDAIRGKEHVILAGDTNAKRNTKTIRNIEKKLQNIFGDELTTSFNTRQKDLEKYPGYATAVVDMAFVSPTLKVIEHHCPNVDISDHLPLVFTIELPGE